MLRSTPVFALLCAVLLSVAGDGAAAGPDGAPAANLSARLPLYFEANTGQTDPRVQFIARGSGYALFLTSNGTVINLIAPATGVRSKRRARPPFPKVPRTRPARRWRSATIRLSFAGAAAQPKVEGLDQSGGRVSYFIGNRPARWRAAIPTFARVRYRDVWPGIDLVYYGSRDGALEYDLIVAPDADPGAIRLRVEGAAVSIDPNGDVILKTATGALTIRRPRIYQERAGVRAPVEGRFVIAAPTRRDRPASQTIALEVAGYDRHRPLVIDPQLVYSTYLGGDGGNPATALGDEATGIALDSSGNVYLTGLTSSTNFPVSIGPGDPGAANGTPVAFVTKLDPTQRGPGSLVYSTYLGGSGFFQAGQGGNPPTADGDVGLGIAVDEAGDAYVTGGTFSTNFPTTAGAFQKNNPTASSDTESGFVAELDPSGSRLLYSTYLGGGAASEAERITLVPGCASSCAAYVAGATMAGDFPTLNGYQSAFPERRGASAAFVSVLAGDGGSLQYSTLLGGSNGPVNGGDGALAIAADAAGNAYVTGFAGSSDFPVVGGIQKSNKAFANQEENAFVAKLDPALSGGASLIYSTCLGGSGTPLLSGGTPSNFGDFGSAIRVDSAGNAFVTGSATSPNFPTTRRALQRRNRAYLSSGVGGSNVFLSEIAPNGGALLYSTLLGGSSIIGDSPADLALDARDRVYLTGATESNDFPTTSNACQTENRSRLTAAGRNAFVTEINPLAGAPSAQLAFSTYFGGTGSDDHGTGIAVDPAGDIYIAGAADSLDLPITIQTAFQASNHATTQGQDNAFMTEFDPAGACPRLSVGAARVNFAKVGVGAPAASRRIVIRNGGKGVMQVVVGALQPPFGVTGSGVYTLDAGHRIPITVTFAPSGTLSYQQTLTIASDDPLHPSFGIELKGSGAPGAIAAPKRFSFGLVRIGKTKVAEITIRDVGLGTLTGKVDLRGLPTQFQLAQQSSSFTLAHGQSWPIKLSFAPDVFGSYAGLLVVHSNDPAHPLAPILISGRAK